MKKLTELAHNPEHCRKVWECVTERTLDSPGDLRIRKLPRFIVIQTTDRKVLLWDSGHVLCDIGGSGAPINPYAILILLAELGYGIGVECPVNRDNDNMR